MTCKLVLANELTINAVTQYLGFNFGSMAKFGGKYYGGDEEGLFQINTGDKDNTSLINAHFKTPVTDFGVRNLKRMRSLFVRGETHFNTRRDNALIFTVENDETNAREFGRKGVVTTQVGWKIPIDRDGKGVNWSVKVANTSGCDFSIDTIEALMLLLKTTDTK